MHLRIFSYKLVQQCPIDYGQVDNYVDSFQELDQGRTLRGFLIPRHNEG